MKFIFCLLRLVFCLLLSLLLVIPIFILFNPILTATSFVIPYAFYPFDICVTAPIAWKYIKLTYCFSCLYICFIISNSVFNKIFKKHLVLKKRQFNQKPTTCGICLYLGKNDLDEAVYLPEKSLFQNILVTGTIGAGKTSSCMYPFVKQLIGYKAENKNEKLGMLILDVKGNFYKQVKKYTEQFGRIDDLYVIELGGKVKYNPLDKPNLKPSVLANRLKTILTLFSPNNSESYWLDKAEEVLTECIKLCRLYNNGYVTFTEIHKLVNSPNYYNEKVTVLRQLFKSRKSY